MKDGLLRTTFQNQSDYYPVSLNWIGLLSKEHSVLNQGFLYTNFDFFYKTSQTVLLVLTFIDMMFEQEADLIS